MALTPFYLPMIIPIEFRMLRLLRLLRIFRVLRLGKYSNAFESFVTVLRSKKEELTVTIVMALIILTLSSSAMYTVEKDAQPEAFGSIPDAMWWAVVTLATVGYGDVYPITPIGKMLAAIVALSAIGLFAMPAGILASGFAESLGKSCEHGKKNAIVCHHCGTVIDPKTGRELERPEAGGRSAGPSDDGEILEELLR
jgi:voltage-gated potassium channel